MTNRSGRPTQRNLDLLVPPVKATPDTHVWATVTQASPLRIRLDNDSVELPFTPQKTIAAPSLSDRVLVLLMSNDDPKTASQRVVVVGKAQ